MIAIELFRLCRFPVGLLFRRLRGRFLRFRFLRNVRILDRAGKRCLHSDLFKPGDYYRRGFFVEFLSFRKVLRDYGKGKAPAVGKLAHAVFVNVLESGLFQLSGGFFAVRLKGLVRVVIAHNGRRQKSGSRNASGVPAEQLSKGVPVYAEQHRFSELRGADGS